MNYKNPIIVSDYSDPDCIRVGDDFYMIASSFNHTPGLPILHSKNLVEWSLIGYALESLPKRFDEVMHGEGVWAPAIRHHNNTFYIVYPMPDEGIYVIEAKDILGPWSEPRLILEGKGLEDPCPLWVDDKCFMAIGFAKSRAGFNSVIGILEVSTDLTKALTDYKIVYDGHDMNPTIEGPKLHYRNGYYYIMAPAGSVKGGWQTCLRSKNIYGPYDAKIVLMQNDSLVNGPHQGALVDLNDSDNDYMFIHFQDLRAYGRIIHLEPIRWVNDWPLCGLVKDDLLCGTPVDLWEYPIDIKTDFDIPKSDLFKDKLSLIWQSPANKTKDFYEVKKGLILKMFKSDKYISEVTTALYTKVSYKQFNLETLIDLSNLDSNDHLGFTIMGQTYLALDFTKIKDKYLLQVYEGKFYEKPILLNQYELESSLIKIKAKFRNKNIYDLIYSLKVDKNIEIKNKKAYAGRWIGSKIGYYAYNDISDSKGYGVIKYYKTKEV